MKAPTGEHFRERERPAKEAHGHGWCDCLG